MILFLLMTFKEFSLIDVHQVEASTNQVADQQMPVYNLPAKILCRVVNVQLKVQLLKMLNFPLILCFFRGFFSSL